MASQSNSLSVGLRRHGEGRILGAGTISREHHGVAVQPVQILPKSQVFVVAGRGAGPISCATPRQIIGRQWAKLVSGDPARISESVRRLTGSWFDDARFGKGSCNWSVQICFLPTTENTGAHFHQVSAAGTRGFEEPLAKTAVCARATASTRNASADSPKMPSTNASTVCLRKLLLACDGLKPRDIWL